MRDVAKAVSALLSVDTRLPVFDGEVATGAGEPSIYAVFYLTTPMQMNRRLSDRAGMAAYTLTTMSVGRSPSECRWAAEIVHRSLSRASVTTPVSTSTPVRLGTAGQVRRDDSINPPAWIATDVWRFSFATKEIA